MNGKNTAFVVLCLTSMLLAGCGGLAPSGALDTPTVTPVVAASMTPAPTASPANLTPSVASSPAPSPTLPVATPTPPQTPPSNLTPTPELASPPTSALSITQLKYKLIDKFGPFGATPGIFYCDPDQFPVARAIEPGLVLKWYLTLDKKTEEYQAVLQHLQLSSGDNPTAAQQLLIYKEYKQLNAISLTPAGDGFLFGLRLSQGGARNTTGLAIEGSITSQGAITIQTQQPTRLTCPICLALGAQIATPDGPVPVQDLRPGAIVWTVTRSGARIAARVVATTHIPVPVGHQIVHLILDDGRSLDASPGHPIADGRTLGDLVPGDRIDGARVVSAQRQLYTAPETYDILPAGDTGFYWADGILVGSTLSR